MLTVLDLLELRLVAHLGVELAILVDVLLVLDLGLVGETRDRLGVLVGELLEVRLVVGLGLDARSGAGGLDGGVVLGIEVILEVLLTLRDQLGDLILVGSLDLLGLLDLGLVARDLLVALGLGEHAVVLGVVDQRLQAHDPRGTVRTKRIDLLLDLADIVIDRLEELGLLVDRQDLSRGCGHIRPPFTDTLHSGEAALPGSSPWC